MQDRYAVSRDIFAKRLQMADRRSHAFLWYKSIKKQRPDQGVERRMLVGWSVFWLFQYYSYYFVVALSRSSKPKIDSLVGLGVGSYRRNEPIRASILPNPQPYIHTCTVLSNHTFVEANNDLVSMDNLQINRVKMGIVLQLPVIMLLP